MDYLKSLAYHEGYNMACNPMLGFMMGIHMSRFYTEKDYRLGYEHGLKDKLGLL